MISHAQKSQILRLSLATKKTDIIYSASDNELISSGNMIDGHIYFTSYNYKNKHYSTIFKIDIDGNNIVRVCSMDWINKFFSYKDSLIFVGEENADNGENKISVYKVNKDGSGLKKIISKTSTFSIGCCNDKVYYQLERSLYEYNLQNGLNIKLLDSFNATCIYASKYGVYCYYPACISLYDFKNSTFKKISK